jgi:hypothetical protein
MEQRDSLIESYRTQQEKYNYYIIAIALACIAFSVNLTIKHHLRTQDIPFGMANLSWLISAFCGLRAISYQLSGIYTNIALLDVASGKHELSGTHPEKIKIGMKTLKQVIEGQSNNMTRLGKMQIYSLYSGVSFFVIWRVLEMLY